jgi:hypothetical protein
MHAAFQLRIAQVGVLSRNRRKFRRPFSRSTGKLLNALDQMSERFVHVLQCGVEQAVVSPAAI